jgi:hypothetical protein
MSDVEGTAGDTSGTVMDRRALLRAGGVVAGIAGIGGYAAAHAPAAAAAAGNPVLMGANNDAGASCTVLTGNEDTPTMILVNHGRGAPLRLEERTLWDMTLGSGDLVNVNGDLRFAHAGGVVGSVYTSDTASHLIPVTPFRAVDTRTLAGRAYIGNTIGHLDSAGRLLGGHTIDIGLGEEVFQGTAVYANLTVTKAVSAGYLTLWPSGPRPGTSSLNYSAGQIVANFCVSGLGLDRVRLYASSTTHVVLDVLAFAAGLDIDVYRALQPLPGVNIAGATRKAPAWRIRRNS